jgi:hypothetical protein
MPFPSELEDLLEEGRIAIRSLIRISLPSGTIGFWNGVGTLTYESVDYVQNHFLRIDEPVFTTGTSANEFLIEMPESADFGITPDILASIEEEDYKNAPILVSDAYFDPDTRALLHVEPMLSGYVDYIDHSFDGTEFKLVGHLESSAIDNHREGYRGANHEDQQLVSPGDTFFEHAARVKHEYFDIEFD